MIATAEATDAFESADNRQGTESVESPESAGTVAPAAPNTLKQTLAPLVIDVAIPLGGYYILHAGFGVGVAAALAFSSVVPAVRTLMSVVVKRETNSLAALMLTVNLAAIALTFVSGNARLMVAKDSVVSSVIAIGILWSVRSGKPMMSAGLKPFLTKGDPRRMEAWDALKADSAKFRSKENLYSVIWGGLLLLDCALRLVLAFALEPSTMAWLGTVITLGAIGLACVLGGAAVQPMELLVRARLAEPAPAEAR
jgi:hypothetical protein